ncbi:hypothetical protein TrRE_jg3239, partial [Triparma retinervis]
AVENTFRGSKGNNNRTEAKKLLETVSAQMRKVLSQIPSTRIEATGLESGLESAGILWLVENGFTDVSDDTLSTSLGSDEVVRGADSRLKSRLIELVRKRLKGWEAELTEYAVEAARRACDGEGAARHIEENEGDDESSTPTPPPPPKSLPELRIAKVKSVLPDLGEGYIELAIACYGGVEGAVEALMEFDQKDLHPRLRGVDRNLPRRKIRDKGSYDAGKID